MIGDRTRVRVADLHDEFMDLAREPEHSARNSPTLNEIRYFFHYSDSWTLRSGVAMLRGDAP